VTIEANQDQTNNTDADVVETGEDTALAVAANEGGDNHGADQVANNGGDNGDGEDEGDNDANDDAPQGAPEKYDTAAFVMPEGVEFDQEGFEAVEPALRDLNLSQDQAGKLMAAYAEKIVPLIAKRTTDAFDEKGAELRANLARDLQADPEVGGKKLEESRSFAAKAIAHFIPDAADRSKFSTFLNESGMGNERFLMRIVAGAGRLVSEASTLAPETRTELTESQKFYGRRGNN
jgi:hypothetical protein